MTAFGTNTSMQKLLGIGQLHHQSATAPSCITLAVDAVAAHQCHELWSYRLHTLLNDRPNGIIHLI